MLASRGYAYVKPRWFRSAAKGCSGGIVAMMRRRLNVVEFVENSHPGEPRLSVRMHIIEGCSSSDGVSSSMGVLMVV